MVYFEECGIKYEVRADECLLLEAGKAGRGYKASGEDTAFFYAVFTSDGKAPLDKHFKLTDSNTVMCLFSLLIKYHGYPDFSSFAKDNLLKSLLYEVKYRSSTENSEHDSRNTFISSVIHYIYQNKHRDLSANDIAQRFRLSRDHLSKVFKASENVSLKYFLNQTKISLIEDMLCTSTYSVKEIANHMGFPYESAMCKFYKYHTGMTPSEYRQKYKIKL